MYTGGDAMREITIKLDDKQYTRIMATAAKRRTTPWTLAKHMLLQLADNDEIEAVTGKRRSDSSVVKRQMYVNQRRKKHDWK